jgi:hypothetical protein
MKITKNKNKLTKPLEVVNPVSDGICSLVDKFMDKVNKWFSKLEKVKK